MTLDFLLGAILALLGIILEAAPAFADVGAEPNLEDAPAILGLFGKSMPKAVRIASYPRYLCFLTQAQ